MKAYEYDVTSKVTTSMGGGAGFVAGHLNVTSGGDKIVCQYSEGTCHLARGYEEYVRTALQEAAASPNVRWSWLQQKLDDCLECIGDALPYDVCTLKAGNKALGSKVRDIYLGTEQIFFVSIYRLPDGSEGWAHTSSLGGTPGPETLQLKVVATDGFHTNVKPA